MHRVNRACQSLASVERSLFEEKSACVEEQDAKVGSRSKRWIASAESNSRAITWARYRRRRGQSPVRLDRWIDSITWAFRHTASGSGSYTTSRQKVSLTEPAAIAKVQYLACNVAMR